MAKDNSWKTVAEVYRDREHKLIQTLALTLESWQAGTHSHEQAVGLLSHQLADHLRKTGRSPEKAVDTPVIIPPVDGARSELLALLGVSERQGGAHSGPVQVRTRKVRSDKGKPRGPRKKKVAV